jgi:sorbitol-6-phosphate 2-dehydrogenase
MQMRQWQRLKGKVAIVTGGGQGLGEALCIRLAEEVCKVAVADINLATAQAVADQLPEAIAVKCDVTDYAQCEKAVADTIDRFGTVDILVSNAAILFSGAIDEMDANLWKKVIDVNLCGCFNICKACTPIFKKQNSGSIIQINSKSGKKGSFKNSAYPASKFGGIGLVQSLALELAPNNIRINAICPGNLLSSPLWRQGENSLLKQYARNQGTTEEVILAKYLAQVPLGRGCEYEDVANMMVFLASAEASYITGQALNVAGGQEMN